MASKICMNGSCGATSTPEWRKGWSLRSDGFANLCDQCGSAYEQLAFCDTFHLNDSGWRECSSCGKRLHCGCIASKSLLELLDDGGVDCISCVKNPGFHSIQRDGKPNGCTTSTTDNVSELQSISLSRMDGDNVFRRKFMQLGKSIEGDGSSNLLQYQKDETNVSFGQINREQIMHPVLEVGSMSISNLNQASNGSSQVSKPDTSEAGMGTKEMYESLAQTCLRISLSASLGTPNLAIPFPGRVAEGREQIKSLSPFQQGRRSRHLLPRPPKASLTTGLENNKDMVPQIRVARPPAEGRGRNQLLPRYWPRITDQELQQISGDSNSTIVPLFEKVLSASDAGRIGRLVLPKACAEAYFPHISQPEGLPLRIQDVKGKEWIFQFRFWPNNNSRMYVLEGVTPCIQSMQLQAGDTVTFSRIDPEGKLVMGFRKASNSVVQLLKGSTDTHLNALSEHLNLADGDISWHKTDKHRVRANESLLLQPMLVPEKKRSRNIGSKSKRLLIDAEDALELKLTWEEAQDLLRPPPSVEPSIVMVEEHEFEEYDVPPVFGKRTIFTARISGGQEQWAQCDSCSKWRKLPVDVLLPPKWTCVDNSWDPSRDSCSAPDEMSPKEVENLLRLRKDLKKRRIAAIQKPAQECEPSGLEALATAAVLGNSVGDPGAPSIATTTKHPRHRPGCTCIVCIQPPSGKGKHKPTCTCNVCLTVKRRFKTLMMRKKKRQSEREAEIAQRKHIWGTKDDAEVDLDPSGNEAGQVNEFESGGQSKILVERAIEIGKGHIDLNCQPDREDNLQAGLMRLSMMSLLQVASLPLETYLKQNGLTSLISSEQQVSSGSHVLPPANGESEGRLPDDGCFASAQEEGGGDDDYCRPGEGPDDTV